MRVVEIDYLGGRLLILGSVRGLVAEAEEVNKHFERFAPEAVALPVGPREIEEIEQTLADKAAPKGAAKEVKRVTGPTGIKDEPLEADPNATEYNDFGLFVSGSDMVFLRRLSKYGDVEMPPPSYQEGLRLGREKGVPTFGVDLDDEAYTDAFIANITLVAMWRQGNKLKRLTKRKFNAKDPDGFALEWDRTETKIRGYMRLQQAREQKMAAGIAAAVKEHGRVLAIVEVERMGGVTATLETIAGAAARAVRPEGESPSHA